MRHFILLAPFLLAACGTNNAQLSQNALAHDSAVCEARGYAANSDDYVLCMRHLGGRVGYQLAKADDGSLAFVIPKGQISQTPAWQPSVQPPSSSQPEVCCK
ncbi:MAG TPA: hypothetical protein VH722_05885 [Alphaproteobacteria bacterium]|nr:hypothetical protein [Alphaproteobacteria bacterium]